MKVLIAGEAAIHLHRYCTAIRPYLREMQVITETSAEFPEADAWHQINLRAKNPFTWKNAIEDIKKIIGRFQPDLIHLHQVNRLALLVTKAAKSLNIPVITTAWGSDVLLVPERNFIYRYFTTWVLKQSRIITADAQIMIDRMLTLEPVPSKYILLQYGIDPVTPVTKEKIIYSNRLHRPLYRIDTIIRDFAKFHTHHHDWKLYVGATGPETENLQSLVNQLQITDAVVFLGWLNKEQNNENYAKASIYISIPESDGTSVSLLEAMSAACIPVVSDLPVTHEWITPGVNGIIRKEGEDAFEAALQLDRNVAVSYNQRLIDEKVNRKNTTARFFELYQQLLKQ
ncbi:MAG: glycosyltransferase family 4 protein [Bacteroidia bacterium]